MERTKYPNNEVLEKWVVEIFRTDSFLAINKTLIQKLGLMEAIILSAYIDKHIYFQNKGYKNNGWFYFIHSDMKKQLCIAESTIRKYKRILIKNKILRIKTEGIPSKEWVKINFTALMKTVGLDLMNVLGHNISKGKHNYRSSTHKKGPTKKERSLEYLPLATKLSEIVSSTINITHTTNQIQSWAYSICQLVEDNKVAPERIVKVLSWYEKNIGAEYVPVVESGDSLKTKFTRLETAMNKKPVVKKYPPKFYDGIRYDYDTKDGYWKDIAGNRYSD